MNNAITLLKTTLKKGEEKRQISLFKAHSDVRCRGHKAAKTSCDRREHTINKQMISETIIVGIV